MKSTLPKIIFLGLLATLVVACSEENETRTLASNGNINIPPVQSRANTDVGLETSKSALDRMNEDLNKARSEAAAEEAKKREYEAKENEAKRLHAAQEADKNRVFRAGENAADRAAQAQQTRIEAMTLFATAYMQSPFMHQKNGCATKGLFAAMNEFKDSLTDASETAAKAEQKSAKPKEESQDNKPTVIPPAGEESADSAKPGENAKPENNAKPGDTAGTPANAAKPEQNSPSSGTAGNQPAAPKPAEANAGKQSTQGTPDWLEKLKSAFKGKMKMPA